MVLLTAVSIVPPVLTLPLARSAPLVAVGIAFLFLSTAIVRRYELAPSPSRASWIFGTQLALTAVAIALSQGQAAPLLFGTLSQAVFFLGPTPALLVTAVSVAQLEWASALVPGHGSIIDRALPVYSAPLVCVVAFSWAMRRQRDLQNRQQRLAEQLVDANEQLRQNAIEAGTLAAERERVRIARDIHDSVGHCLTNAHIQLELAATLLDSDTERARAAVGEAGRSTREALAEVRRSVAALRDGAPLAEGIAALLERVRATGVVAELALRGSTPRLAVAVESALFRVAQEAVTNAQRHACATRVDVTLIFGESTVALEVRDDGVGAVGATGGFGLRAMEERMREVGGALWAESPEGGGFVIVAEVPLQAVSAEAV